MSQAHALDHIVERSFVADPTGEWTLQQAQAQSHALQPFTGLLTQGYGAGALWVRLRIDPSMAHFLPEEALYLRLRPIYLDHIQVFDEVEGFQPRPTLGDRHPLNHQDELATFYLLKLKPGTQPRTIWVRLSSTSTRTAHFEVLNEAHLQRSNLIIQSFGAIYLALMGVFVLWGLIQTVLRHDHLHLTFTAYQLVALFHGATSLGYTRLLTSSWLPPAVLDPLYSASVVVATFMVLLYSHFLLNELVPALSRWRNSGMWGLSSLFAMLLFLQGMGETRVSLAINMTVVLFMPLLIFVWAWRSPGRQPTPSDPMGLALPKPAVLVYLGITSVFTAVAALPSLGWLPAVEFTLYSVLLYSVCAGLLMLGMLQYRTHFLYKQRDALLRDAQRAHERVELERSLRLEREQLLDMLGHEIKTPLATLRMLLGSQHIPPFLAQPLTQSVDEINGVIERTVQTGQLENQAIRVQLEPCNAWATLQTHLNRCAQHSRFEWQVHPSCETLQLNTDPFLLGVIVRNLAENALKYSPDDSTVTVELPASHRPGWWRLSLVNSVGRAGHPDPQRVFDKYWRGALATYRSGSGQGLYIASRLAKLLGGELHYQAQPLAVQFILELPTHSPTHTQVQP